MQGFVRNTAVLSLSKDGGVFEPCADKLSIADVTQIKPERQPLHQRIGRVFVLRAVVQQRQQEPCIIPPPHPVALGNNDAGIHHGSNPARDALVQPLGHRYNDQPAIGFGEQPHSRDRPVRR